MKNPLMFIFTLAIALAVMTSAFAWENTSPVVVQDFGTTSTLSCEGDAISLASGAHQMNTGTHKRSFSIQGASYRSCQAISFGGGFNIDQNIYISFAYTAGEGDGAITGGGLFLF